MIVFSELLDLREERTEGLRVFSFGYIAIDVIVLKLVADPGIDMLNLIELRKSNI